MPESKDTDWAWDEFVRRNNDELVATWGNLANRVLSFAYKNWDGVVPFPGDLRPSDEEIIRTVDQGFVEIGDHIGKVRLRAALTAAMNLAGEVNRYLDQAAPWFEIKQNRDGAGTTIYTALRVIDSLKTLLAPFLPFTCERLHAYLGYEGPLFGEQYVGDVEDSLGVHTVLRYRPGGAAGRWEPSKLSPGQKLTPPQPLFKKLEPEVAQLERARLGS
jgi:methionyl-tRNA synthetase